jgi:hypothetical protein
MISKINYNSVPVALQQTLDEISPKLADRKNEVIDLLCGEQPTKSREVELTYTHCTWWEGCYYCRDEAGQWNRIKCFI